MLHQILKTIIEEKTAEIMSSNLFLKKTATGSLTRDEVALYLFNLSHLFSHGPKHLGSGAIRATQLGHKSLAEFLESKIKEELGHENWPKDDLKKCFGENQSNLFITSQTKDLVEFIQDLVDTDPRHYVAYMAFVEYFTVLAAPEFLDNLEKKCGIPKTGMTAVGNHQVSDQDHIDEDLEMISLLPEAETLQDEMMRVLDESALRVGELLNSCLKWNH